MIFLADPFFLRGRHLGCKRSVPFFVIWRSDRHCISSTIGDNSYKIRTLFLIQLLMLCGVLISRILCLWFCVSLIYINNCPTRCNTKQSIYYSENSLYMFRVSNTPIIRSTQNCNYSLRYWSYFFVQLPPSNVAWRL